jgi:ribose-phosphate pyrophosphokinase
MSETNFKVFSVEEDILTDRICKHLSIQRGNLVIDTFSDGEFSPQFKETIRENRVFLVCSTNTPEKILKFLLAVDAAKRASASEIVAVIPYFGYSRQDRKEGVRGPIGAKLMADILSASGIDRLITLDLHAAQIQGFFNFPVDHVNGYRVFSSYFKNLAKGTYTICSPDAGGVKRAMAMYNKFVQFRPDCDVNFAMMSKRRDKPNSIESMELIGDVVGRQVILVDDMTDTAGTLIKASEILLEKGAENVSAIVTHAVLSGNAKEKVKDNPSLMKLISSDSLKSSREAQELYPGCFVTVSCAETFAQVISNVATGKSIHE